MQRNMIDDQMYRVICLKKEYKKLSYLLQQLNTILSEEEKISFLYSIPEVKMFFSKQRTLKKKIKALSVKDQLLFLHFVSIGQAIRLFPEVNSNKIETKKLQNVLPMLRDVNNFYSLIGGILGYQITTIEVLLNEYSNPTDELLPPQGIDISKCSLEVCSYIIEGILQQEIFAEIYPIGGIGDRFKCSSGSNEQSVPTAMVPFLGRTLLEGLIRDLQAREYLHYLITGKQLVTPIILMTSEEDNHFQIFNICKENKFFGRDSKTIFFLSQPLVPTFTKYGQWCLKDENTFLCKPGGHGAIWKLALDSGSLTWLQKMGRQKVLIRQINNPIAGCDYGILAFTGIGASMDSSFGFASCLRQIKTQEGVNVIKYNPEQNKTVLSCVEYCDFKKYHMSDIAVDSNSIYSSFPSNTNIIFADITTLQQAVHQMPYPNFIVNFKEDLHFIPGKNLVNEEIARLESTMQHISEAPIIADSNTTYLTLHDRKKTISAVKRYQQVSNDSLETIEGGFRDLLYNNLLLLQNHCKWSLGSNICENFDTFPGLFLYHPALGPVYSIIVQKLKSGRLSSGAELQLEISDIIMDQVVIEGSLVIIAKNIMGHWKNGTLHFSSKVGKCIFQNVQIKNQGIEYSINNAFWKNAICRKELCYVELEGNSLFVARDIVIEGNQHIFVPNGKKMIATKVDGKILYQVMPLSEDEESLWDVQVNEDNKINLITTTSYKKKIVRTCK